MTHPSFNPLEHPICLELPELLDETAWAGHTPFAMFLASALKPRMFVELGTYRGVSYCAFCQAVKAVDTGTRCFAVDTWKGDEHAGKLGEEVWQKLRSHHDPRYGGFSELVRATFDEALSRFEDKTIDLLHIDGLHTYEAVRHDFESWLPKMSDRGIVLFHDIEVRERGFGVYRFWEEISINFPSFAFEHEHGLGVLAVGHVPQEIGFLFSADEQQSTIIRKFFSSLGQRVKLANALRMQKEQEPKLFRAYHILRGEGARSLAKKAISKLGTKPEKTYKNK